MTRIASKTPSKITATAKVAGKTEQPLRTEDEQSTDTLMADFVRAKDALLAKLAAPGWKRMLAAACVTLAVGVGVGWLAGFVIDFLTLGVLAFTGSAYAGMVVWVLGVIMMCVAAGKLGAMAWDAVVTGRADEAITESFGWVKRKLGFGKSELVAA